MTARRRRERSALLPLRRTARPTGRVLLLLEHVAHPTGDLDTRLAAHLATTSPGTDLDVISSPTAAVRVILEHEHALDRYDAVVAVTAAHDRRAKGSALVRAVPRLAERLATLHVRVGSADAPTDDGTGAPALVLPPDASAGAATRQVAAALQTMLGARTSSRPPLDPQAMTLRRLFEIARLARETVGLDAVEINLIDRDEIVTVAAAGSPAPHRHPRLETFCSIALDRAGITVMPDSWLDPDAHRLGAAKGAEPIRFYAGIPLHDATGARIGMFCAHDPLPGRQQDLDLGLLTDLALLVEGELIESPLPFRRRLAG